MIDQLEPDINVIPVFSSGRRNIESIEKYFFDNKVPLINVMVSFHWFRINTFHQGILRRRLRFLKN